MRFWEVCCGLALLLSLSKLSNGLDASLIYQRREEFAQMDYAKLEELARDMSVANQIPNAASIQQYRSRASSGNISEKCLDSLEEYADHLNGLLPPRPYAFQMDYSSGHLPDNVIQTFNFTWSVKSNGYISLCDSIELPAGLSFETTQYCILRPKVKWVEMVIGKCLPGSCSEEDIYKYVNSGYNVDGFEIFVFCAEIPPLSIGAICTIVLTSVIVLIIIWATLYDYWIREEQKKANSKTERYLGNGVKSTALDLEKTSVPPLGKAEKALANGVQSVASQDSARNDENVEKDIRMQEEEITSFGKSQKLRPISQMQLVEKERHSKTKTGPGIGRRVLLTFSFLVNSSHLLSTNQSGNLRALNGLRVLSLFWVILGHTVYYVSIFTVYLDNVKTLLNDVMSAFGSQLIWNATLAVDTFFFLSGLLVAYFTVLELDKRGGKMNWFLYYFHRYWRLTPIYAFVILVYLFVVPYFGIGPHTYYNFTPAFTGPCQNYWWTNLLYINNLYPYPGSLEQQCIGWSWYLANDFQFFVISPFFTYLLYKNWRVGLSLTLSMAMLGVLATATSAIYYGLPVGLNAQHYNDNKQNPADDVLYGKPWSRLPVYQIGLATGWLIYFIDSKKITIEPYMRKHNIPAWVKKVLVAIGWLLSTGIAFGCLFGLWPTTQGFQLPQWQAILYLTLYRLAWALAIAWVAFACIRGYAGPVGEFLSWDFWIPMARLTYGAYLIHSIMIISYLWNLDMPVYFEYYSGIYLFLGHLFVSYVAAFFVSVSVEMPMIGLEKVMLGKAKK